MSETNFIKVLEKVRATNGELADELEDAVKSDLEDYEVKMRELFGKEEGVRGKGNWLSSFCEQDVREGKWFLCYC